MTEEALENKKEKEIEKEEILLEWRVHLLKKEKPYRAVLTIIAVVSCMVLAFQVMSGIIEHSMILPLVLAVFGLIFYFSLAEFFFPINYKLTTRGAYIFSWTGMKFIEWKKVKKAYKNEDGVKLSIFPYPSPFESFRGMFMRYGDKKDELISTVKAIVNPDSAA